MTSRVRAGTAAVLGLRIAYGVTLMISPGRLTLRWLGPDSSRAPTQVPLRGLGAREIVLHTGALIAAVRDRPLRPWLAGSIAGDCVDIAATVLGRAELPDAAPLATAVVAGASALISAALFTALDD
ncbi:MAG TPA: hypothetical protein VIM18_00990 [Solirubrobacteraceae bacterium]